MTDLKLTLAPYAGLGPARGFELDLYTSDLLLAGDLLRLVVARKVPSSDVEVTAKTRNPRALQGECGPLLGRWTADLPGESVELVFRPDGQFRLSRCSGGAVSHDYGLYSADINARTLVSDSRCLRVQALGLDAYGETMTLFGGSLRPPSTYTVNLGTVQADIAASFAADAEAARVDAEWLQRVPIGPRAPGAVETPTASIPADPPPTASIPADPPPTASIPADPHPEHVFDQSDGFTQFTFYRRLSPGFVYFNAAGVIKTVPVVNTREFSFFPTGRVLVRFKN